jgi:hypothetical protein
MNCDRIRRLMVFGALCLSVAGCNERQQQGKNASGQTAPTQQENGSSHTAPADSDRAKTRTMPPDSASHPAVSTQVGVDDQNSATKPASETPPAYEAIQEGTPNAPPSTPDSSDVGPIVTPTPPPGTLPTIALTAAHRATCKVFVGDALPPLNVTDLDGNSVPLDKSYGSRLTLVVFWQHNDADGVEALSDLEQLVVAPYGHRGVRAVAIHAGAANEEVKSLVQQKHIDVPMFVDADGSALAQVSDDVRGLMPRLFLIDSAGRILWFDIEYSRTTRRDLDAALRYLTRQ